MAATRPDIIVPLNTWTDLYATVGIAVGTNVIVTNKSGGNHILLATGAAAPTDDRGVPLQAGMQAIVEEGELGLYAKAITFNALINVQEG